MLVLVRRWILLPALIVSLTGSLSAQAADVTVYAAASLSNALKDIATSWKLAHKDDDIRSSFAASSILAKQIEAGAPADIFVAADKKWMDYLADRGLIEKKSRRDLLGNTLVVIAPAEKLVTVNVQKGAVAPDFSGKLCMGEPGSVPAGIYGKQALQSLGWWPVLEKRVVATEDVRTALAFVERAECLLGIVYETDAKVSRKVMIAARFPAGSHDPVVYPLALLPQASATAKDFFSYLQSPAASVVFQRYGFTVLKP
jgi:molybdate transport system substrate-binding protein